MREQNWRRIAPWALTGIVSFLAIWVWGQSFDWQFSEITVYQWFPVLGLLAFSIMWSHYVVGSVQHSFLKGIPLAPYFRYTSYAVLVAILLHPGLLIYQRFRDGFGLPPHSYETYVAPSMAWLTLLGSVSLLVFLAFELHRWYGQKPWWRYVLMAGDVAMLAIFYHGLRLGHQLQVDWYRIVWIFYGIVLVIILGQKYAQLLAHHTSHNANLQAHK